MKPNLVATCKNRICFKLAYETSVDTNRPTRHIITTSKVLWSTRTFSLEKFQISAKKQKKIKPLKRYSDKHINSFIKNSTDNYLKVTTQ